MHPRQASPFASPFAVRLPRRRLLQLGAGAGGAVLLSACGPDVEEAQDAQENGGDGGGSGDVVFLSTQFEPVEEAETMRNAILAGFDGPAVEFIGSQTTPFHDRVQAEAEAGEGPTALLGGEHGDMTALAANDLLMDLSDLAEELSDADINPDFMELASFGGDQVLYIPWMQATYIMAARAEALDFLDGDPQSLTYDGVLAWAQAIQESEGTGRFGLPAGADGLMDRFLEGHLYPSWTGGLNTTFRSPEAVQAWEWLKQAWAASNPQSTTYAFMQEPLLAGEVWVTWDHVARLRDAFLNDPDGFVAMPSPTGPEGLGFLAVVAGLAIPKTSPNPEGAREVIRYLLRPETGALTLREQNFFPPTAGATALPEDLEPGLRAMAEVVIAQTNSPDAVTSLLPRGLGENDAAYRDVFRESFASIVVNNAPIEETLASQGDRAQQLLEEAGASCWEPDPVGEGVCQVG
jgi:multiple sugar transport system substrate-binding protein